MPVSMSTTHTPSNLCTTNITRHSLHVYVCIIKTVTSRGSACYTSLYIKDIHCFLLCIYADVIKDLKSKAEKN